MLRVAFVGALSASFAESVRARLAVPCDIVVIDEAHIVALMPEVDVLVTLVFTPAMAAAAKQLRLVQVPGAGLDRIDRASLPAATSLANVHGHETAIAEYVLGAMLAMSRSFGRLDAALRVGRWESQWAPGTPPAPWPELAGRTLGILGYGHIGQALARRARAFDMDVLAIRRNAPASDPYADVFGPGRLHHVLGRADYLAVTLPLTPATRSLIGEGELRRMKESAILINVARAEIVDEDALYHALAAKRIAGAALDVWYRYPASTAPTFPSRQPFHELPNVLMTPHVSGWTDGMLAARAQLIAENIRRIAEGVPPANLVARA